MMGFDARIFALADRAARQGVPRRWLSNAWRRKQDHFAREAKIKGLRSRAAFKLEQINAKHKILRPGMAVCDLGAAPGGWTVVAAKLVQAGMDAAAVTAAKQQQQVVPAILRYKEEEPLKEEAGKMKAGKHRLQPSWTASGIHNALGAPKKPLAVDARAGRVVACDLLPMLPVKGATIVQGDFTSHLVQAQVLDVVKEWGGLDAVLSDMAPNTSGLASRDHAIIMELARAALSFAHATLKPRGAFCVKLFNGAELHEFLALVKQRFEVVKIVKPEASRSESSELYVYASQFKPALKGTREERGGRGGVTPGGTGEGTTLD